jgi:iron complex outermembrane receptor protein
MPALQISKLPHAIALALPALSLLCSQALAQSTATNTLPPVTVNANRVNTNPLPGAATLDTANLAASVPATSDTRQPAARYSRREPVWRRWRIQPASHSRPGRRPLRIKVDGMDLIASCPNHMNPALSYIDPTNVGALQVYAGVAPVSTGGDRLAAPSLPNRARPSLPHQAGSVTKGEVGTFYRSNNQASGRQRSRHLRHRKFQHQLPRLHQQGRQLHRRCRLQKLRFHRPRRPHAGAQRSRLHRV